jgi:hypothetical protein
MPYDHATYVADAVAAHWLLEKNATCEEIPYDHRGQASLLAVTGEVRLPEMGTMLGRRLPSGGPFPGLAGGEVEAAAMTVKGDAWNGGEATDLQ